MYGAMLGDIIGSPYDKDGGGKTKDFPLFSKRSHYTDDTVMTFAVCSALLKSALDAEDEVIKKSLVKECQKWGRSYPHAGYGADFIDWIYSNNPQPYGSWGNGAAMRVSSIGWLYDNINRTRHVARLTASITHNHIEGKKGAESVASAIFLARTGHTKEKIKEYIEKKL